VCSSRFARARLCALALFCSLVLAACGGGGSGSTGNAAAQSYSVSGELILPSNMERDLDTQVEGSSIISPLNNTFGTAQILNNPSSVGGYVSFSQYQYANSQPYAEDREDYYKVPLLEGQFLAISVFHAENTSPSSINLVMEVYRDDGNLNDLVNPIGQVSFTGEGGSDFVIPQDGDHFVRIRARSLRSGPMLYRLVISDTLASGMRLNAAGYQALATDELVVRYKAQPNTLADTNSSGVLGLVRASGFASFSSSASTKANSSAKHLAQSQNLQRLKALRAAESLKSNPNIADVEPNYKVKAANLGVNDIFSPLQWNLMSIGLPDAWNASTGIGSRVAVIDSGIDSTHIDIQSNVSMSEGYDFVSATNNGDGDGRDTDPTDVIGSSYHGTLVSGVIAASTNNAEGIAGVAYDATIIPLRALGSSGSGSSYDIADAILYAAGLSNSTGLVLSPRADVINLSLGLSSDSFVIRDAVRAASARGVIVVAAAGNDSSSTPFYPAAYDEVIGVGSINHERARSGFSNYGVNIDLMAPGGTNSTSPLFDGIDDGIIGPLNANQYAELIGTSFATPHVVATAALMKQLRPDLDASLFRYLLEQGSLTDARDNEFFYGKGIINAAKAVAAVGGALPDDLIAFPQTLSFTNGSERLVLDLSNPGQGSVEVVSVTSNRAWLTVADSDTNGLGLGRYAIEMVPQALSGDISSGELTVAYRINGGSLETLAVSAFFSRQAKTSDIGEVYVYLLPRATVENSQNSPQPIVLIQAVESDQGSYLFDFPAVPVGNYYLEASTDLDGDGTVLDNGEAIGAYRWSNDTFGLDVRSDQGDLEFSIGYQTYHEAVDFASPSVEIPFRIRTPD
jgi:serine protease